MQLSRPGTLGSRGSPGWNPDPSASACLTCAVRFSGAMSAQRRRSKAISTSVSAVSAGSATGLLTTASRKFCLYWIQSQTTRSRPRSAGEAQTASMIGPGADSGTVQDAGDGLLVPGYQQVHPGHALDRAQLLDGLGREPRALRGGLVRRDRAQPA